MEHRKRTPALRRSRPRLGSQRDGLAGELGHGLEQSAVATCAAPATKMASRGRGCCAAVVRDGNGDEAEADERGKLEDEADRGERRRGGAARWPETRTRIEASLTARVRTLRTGAELGRRRRGLRRRPPETRTSGTWRQGSAAADGGMSILTRTAGSRLP
jgi:hypothetical protein